MNFLILGGSGYLGSKTARALVDAGHSVVCTRRASSDLSRLADIASRIEFVPASAEGAESAMRSTAFDWVLNMACNYGQSSDCYGGIIEANLEFPLKVLNAAATHGVKKVLTIGTGLPDDLNMYSFSKKVLSEFGNFYAVKHGITFDNLLLEMFYGADEPETRFLPSVVSKMIDGETVKSTIGTQKRDIIASADVVKAVLMVIGSKLTGYNEIPVGTGTAPSISEILDFIWENTGKRSQVLKGAVPMRKNEPDCVADTVVLSSLGTWDPVPWKAGLLDMIRRIREKKSRR